MKIGYIAPPAAILALSACTYTAPATTAPSYDVFSNYDNKLDSRVALIVDSNELQEDVRVSGFACSAHTYPIDARNEFRTSVIKTFENLVREVEPVDDPIDVTQMNKMGYDTVVYVQSEDMDVDLRVIPGFWTADLEAETEIAASIRAETPEGRALGRTVEGDGEGRAESGAACEGGAQAVGESVAQAIEDTMRRLGERLSNSQRLRAPELAER
jgi:hypothetical protein